jgi:predicted Zn-dependent protease with MMP-like domain
MTTPFSRPPDLRDIESLAKLAYGEIPEILREKTQNVVIRIEEFPDRETQRELGLQSPFELMGVYRGVPFGERSVTDTPQDINLIILYRRPLLDYWCETQEDFTRLVRHVLIHEIGHHFGFSDEEMARIEGTTGQSPKGS